MLFGRWRGWGTYPADLRRTLMAQKFWGQTARQRRLQRLEATWRGIQYDGRAYDWDGRERREDDAAHGLPKVAGNANRTAHRFAADVPRVDRVPCVQSKLSERIVAAFTDMLFGEGRCPSVSVEGDKDSTAWLTAAIEQASFWSRAVKARDYGGAEGTAVLLVRLRDGQFRVDPLNPRHCTVLEWEDRTEYRPAKVEECYPFMDEEVDDDGVRRDRMFWYRRVIDRETDRIWRRVPAMGKGTTDLSSMQLPVFEDESEDVETTEHGLGVCPVVWIQNEDVDDEVDGRGDFEGQEDNIQELDYIQSEASASVLANLDATLCTKGVAPQDVGVVRTGRLTTLSLPKDSNNASFLEISGASITAGDARAERLEQQILQACQVVLVNPKDVPGMGQGKDAMEAMFRPMLSRCNRLRGQYGPGVKRVCELLLALGRANPKGVVLPPKVTEKPAPASSDGTVGDAPEPEVTEHTLGQGNHLVLKWPGYFDLTADDRQKETTSAGTAVTQGVLSIETVVAHLAPFWGVKNPQEEVARLKKEAQEKQAAAMAQGAAFAGGSGSAPGGKDEESWYAAGARKGPAGAGKAESDNEPAAAGE